ncbi:hypothetical protein ETE01_01315 [Synechococcus sp. HB1133]|uniref:hypothetical protein n=1 Tax=Synechococcus sp. HBA1120 TaxID=2508341 RepID=UPI001CF8E89E|nr:hypothetical protein [Synechococcus sp. HBA1120]MCB4431172.1 hypothetical protein [Synechococcus sp. HBA1120]NHI80419.1 hypothetical protein [Synechococcus sp. HB1133]
MFDKSLDEKMLLSNGYDEIVDLTIEQYCISCVDKNIDVVTALDVLEHLPRSKFFDVIDQMLYHCKFMIIIWPVNHPQNAGTNFLDSHRSSVKPREVFQSFEVISFMQTGFSEYSIFHIYNLCVLRGHMCIDQKQPLF